MAAKGAGRMKLADLHPEFRSAPGDDSLYELGFDCPACGAPYRQHIKARLGGPHGPAGIWAWTAAPFSNIPPVPLDWSTVTITPSVQCEGFSAHGRKRACNAHFTVTNGEVQLA